MPASREAARNVTTSRSGVPSAIAYMAVFRGIREIRDLAAALISGAIQVVRLPCFHELHCRTLRRDVALGRAEKFVANHEFLNRSGAQERRKVVRVEVPLFVGAAVGGLLVKSHGIRESRLKQIVVTNGDAPQDVAQEI